MSRESERDTREMGKRERKGRLWPWLVALGGLIVLAGSMGLCLLAGYALSTRQSSTSLGGDAVGPARDDDIAGAVEAERAAKRNVDVQRKRAL